MNLIDSLLKDICRYQAENFGELPRYLRLPEWRQQEFYRGCFDTIHIKVSEEDFSEDRIRGIPIIWSKRINYIELGS